MSEMFRLGEVAIGHACYLLPKWMIVSIVPKEYVNPTKMIEMELEKTRRSGLEARGMFVSPLYAGVEGRDDRL